MKIFNWIRYSGASVSITLNPFHWSWIPNANTYNDTWGGPNEHTVSVSLLFLTIRIWIDNGDW